MPEFVLDHGTAETAKVFRGLDSFTQGYIEALFFTDEEQLCEESGRDMPDVAINLTTMEARFVGGDTPGFADLAPSALTCIIADCAKFQEANAALIERACALGEAQACYDETSAGRDFWYSRNGHGVGFWDRGLGEVGDKLDTAAKPYSQADTYVGDDGMIYIMGAE